MSCMFSSMKKIRAGGIAYLKSRAGKRILILARRISVFLVFLSICAIRFGSPKYRRLIIRKGTTDSATFWDIFVSNRFRAAAQL